MLPQYRRYTGAVEAIEAERGAFLGQTIHGIRTVKSLSLESRQSREWDRLTARVARAKFAEGNYAALLQALVMPLERLMISGSFALGVYLALTTADPTLTSSLFVFLLLSQRLAAPLIQASQLIQQFDEARAAVGDRGLPRQSAPGRGPLWRRRPQPDPGPRRVLEGAVHLQGGAEARAEGGVVRDPARHHAGRHGPLGLGQDDHHPPGPAAQHRLRGPAQDRRRRRAPVRPHPPALVARRRAAGELPVLRHHPLQHHHRQAGRHLRRDGPRGPARRRRRVHREAARRLRDPRSTRARRTCRAASASASPSPGR